MSTNSVFSYATSLLSLVFLASCSQPPTTSAHLKDSQPSDFRGYCENRADADTTYTVRIIMRTLQEDDCALAAEQIKALKQISLPREDMRSIAPLQGMNWMNAVELTGNHITDMSPLASWSNMTIALLNDNQFSSLTFVETLPKLVKLRIANNKISDLSPLIKNTSIQDLDISLNAEITDLKPIAHLPLARLGMRLMPVGHLLGEMLPQPKMTALELNGSSVSDVSALASDGALPALSKILLRDNQISDVTPLAKLTNLIALDLANNPILDLSPLASLTKLVALDLTGVPARNGLDVVRATKLTTLLIPGHDLRDLAWTADLSDKLESLDVSNNSITDVTPLYRFHDITSLKLSGNAIQEIDTKWLISLPKLKVLELDVQRIKNPEDRRKILDVMTIAFERNRS